LGQIVVTGIGEKGGKEGGSLRSVGFVGKDYFMTLEKVIVGGGGGGGMELVRPCLDNFVGSLFIDDFSWSWSCQCDEGGIGHEEDAIVGDNNGGRWEDSKWRLKKIECERGMEGMWIP